MHKCTSYDPDKSGRTHVCPTHARATYIHRAEVVRTMSRLPQAGSTKISGITYATCEKSTLHCLYEIHFEKKSSLSKDEHRVSPYRLAREDVLGNGRRVSLHAPPNVGGDGHTMFPHTLSRTTGEMHGDKEKKNKTKKKKQKKNRPLQGRYEEASS